MPSRSEYFFDGLRCMQRALPFPIRHLRVEVNAELYKELVAEAKSDGSVEAMPGCMVNDQQIYIIYGEDSMCIVPVPEAAINITEAKNDPA